MSSRQVKDLSIIITSFYMKFVGFWLANNYVEKRRRNVALSYTLFAVLLSLSTEARDLYFSWGDLGDSIYVICNVITIVLVVVKIFILLIYNEELLDIIDYAKINFWHLNYDSHEQMIVDNCRRTCTIFVCVFTFFAQGTVIGFIARPLLINYGKNESERILPFNMWLPECHLSMTPYFELMFMLQVVCSYHVGVCYHCFDNVLCILNLHTAAQFRILQYRLTNMCNTNDCAEFYEVSEKSSYSIHRYGKLRTYIQQHQALTDFCKKLEDVFNLIVLGQVSLFSLLICLDGYLILMDDAPTTRRFTFAFHITGCMCQLLMFTYSCDCLIRDSANVANAAYKSLWSRLPMDQFGKILRKDLILVIMRSATPSCLTACGFFTVSLETYTGILSSAVSYFTLLRNQSNDN
ncbi:odorant receptor 13a-like [Bombus vancouverensis nearcticus]|uniref:odorant receptor 13a-like n=1 Tax=Bombus vancouverensis nearcticus TaxID=2705178 RepID=UPI00402B48DE